MTLKLVAQYGSACNVGGDVETIRHKFDVLRGHCETVGRDYNEIIRSSSINVHLVQPGDDPERATAAARGATSFEEFSRGCWVGTTDEISARLEPLIAAGVNYVLVYMPRIAYDHAPLQQFASEVMPRFQ